MKFILVILFSTLFLLGGGSVFGAEVAEDVTILINDEELEINYPARIKDGRTLVPARPIFEALGAEMGWDEENRVAYGDRNGYRVGIAIGEKEVEVDGWIYEELDVAAEIYDGRTYIPLRFSGEAFGAEVEWDEANRKIIIENNYKEMPELKDKITNDKFIDLFELKKHEIEDEFGQYDSSGFFLGAYLVYYENIVLDNYGGLIQSDSLVFHLTSPEENGKVILLSSIEQFADVTTGMRIGEAMEELNWPSRVHLVDHKAEGLYHYYFNYYLDNYRIEFQSEAGKNGPIDEIQVFKDQ
ncbi:copper amine oxidase N-terminal domain-containing protein [Natranaerofaba carboxydovora]|uniref:copper amine oxidase N-terminal domain-containing protein n=1 Tax=Natranaerofaba carboxydovora TaxID=2742683 RepID=UPI001F142DF9|nr:copper amine oxidase N-terminal domain-containing protein [Natranaerofaba carboxydovora]UMZ72793.1 hypothetical protein ACONDI_00322 [Natranaerofaba carboxydovora]